MARIAGIDIPRERRVEIALTYIFGIGLPTSQKILVQANVNPDTRVRDLTEEQVNRLRDIIGSGGAAQRGCRFGRCAVFVVLARGGRDGPPRVSRGVRGPRGHRPPAPSRRSACAAARAARSPAHPAWSRHHRRGTPRRTASP